MLYREIIAVCSEIRTKQIKTDKLMLYREIIAVCSEIHTKHINALWTEHRISECYSWSYVK